MKKIFIVLTRSSSVPSRIIGHFTGDAYTHASLAFEEDLRKMYSFARRYASFPFPAGFMEEHTDGKFYQSQGDIPCAVLTLELDAPRYYRLRARVAHMLCRSREYRYSYLGVLLCKINLPLATVEKSSFCSRFVAEMLQSTGMVSLPKTASLMRPVDFLQLPALRCIYEGGLEEWNQLCLSHSLTEKEAALQYSPA